MMHRSRAQTMVWVAVLVPLLFLPIVGLSIDAGVLFDQRRDLQNLADSAARTAAMMIDIDVVRSGRGDVQIDVPKAREEARDFLRNRAGFGGDIRTDETTSQVAVVRISRDVRPRFLSLFGVRRTTMSAVGRALPCSGTTQADVSCTSP